MNKWHQRKYIIELGVQFIKYIVNEYNLRFRMVDKYDLLQEREPC